MKCYYLKSKSEQYINWKYEPIAAKDGSVIAINVYWARVNKPWKLDNRLNLDSAREHWNQRLGPENLVDYNLYDRVETIG